MDVMNRLAKSRYLRIVGFALGAVAVSGAAVLITASAAGVNVGFRPAASSPAPATTASIANKANASALCNSFIAHLSSDLGKTPAQVNAAIQKAIGETLADEVKNGDLTQAQADAIGKKVANQQPCALTGVGRLGEAGGSATIGAYMPQLVTAAAGALGVSETQLKADLAAGKSLSQIAAAKNPPMTEAQFRTNLIAKLKPLLDTAVTNKKLTATQEQAILQRLQTAPIPYWNTPMKRKATAPASPKAGG
jgi:hypothetical protein